MQLRPSSRFWNNSAVDATNPAPAVKMLGISKRFGRVRANDSIDFTVSRGTLHAIIGENGSGKSTLMRILYGSLRPDRGRIEIDGQRVSFHSPKDAIGLGVGMASQQPSIIPELSCIENLLLGAGESFLLQRDAAIAKASADAKRLGFEFEWTRSAGESGPAGMQKLEILRQLWRGARLLILDEPTALLSPLDSEALFRNLKSYVEEGNTVILVTHRLRDVVDFCTHATVLRGGKKVSDLIVSETSLDQMSSLIVGETAAPASATVGSPGDALLSLKDFHALQEDGRVAAAVEQLTVRSGEIVGIAGVDGNGQRPFLESLLGVRRHKGSLVLAGTDIGRWSVRERIAGGVTLIPEVVQTEGLVLDWPLLDNALIGNQWRKEFRRSGLIDRRSKIGYAGRMAARMRAKVRSVEEPAQNLSGGNQQRFAVGRALEMKPRVCLGLQPTRGLDVSGAATFYEEVASLCGEGACAILVSNELDELLERCHRVLVMFAGRLLEVPESKSKDRHAIGRMMVGLDP